LQESGFPLEARVRIEAVCRFKQSINSLREKPEVKSWKCKASSAKLAMRSRKWWLLATIFYWSENVGNREFSGKIRHNSATHLAFTD
jgi:hypothetical protein